MNTITILIPVYKGSHLISKALGSLTKQTFKQFDVIVGDDNKPESREESRKTKKIVDQFRDAGLSISYVKNKTNLGCHKNFESLVHLAKTPIVLFLAQDDIFSVDAVKIVFDAFKQYPKAAFLTRPYFWFETDIHKPIRYIPPLNHNKNEIVSITDGEKAVKAVFTTVGQISGLAIRKKLIRIPYHTDIFPGHIYPLADLLKDYPAICIKDYIVAVGTVDSQSRNISSIYDTSPTEQWIKMYNTIYADSKYDEFRKLCIKHITTNFEGLVQIKNYGSPGKVEKEIVMLLKYRWQNIFEPKFWMYSLIAVLLPRTFLIRLTDWYKRNLLSQTIPHIPFSYKA